MERLNSKQKFIISSNTLSLIVFFFQFVNLIKSIFVTVTGASEWLVIVLNYLFDLYPFLLLIFYCRDVGSRQKNMIRSSTLLSSQQLRSWFSYLYYIIVQIITILSNGFSIYKASESTSFSPTFEGIQKAWTFLFNLNFFYIILIVVG